MTTAAVNNPVVMVQLGAAELKRIINENTRRGFYITIAILILLALLSFTYRIVMDAIFPPPNVVKVKLAKVSLDMLAPPPSQNEEAPPPPPPTAVPPVSGPAVRAGMPVAVPDAMIAEDLKDFANIDEINRASAIGGDGNDMGNFASNIGESSSGLNIETREETPDIDEFVSVEKEPDFDYAALQRRVKYPDIARRNGVEGQVLVGALVGKDGKVEKTQVIETDNELLNQSAVNAVRETVFTPAIQNGAPVRLWVRIPIVFKLR
ncbi:MAG: energy transducer TonB [Bradyrhizobiaceae bacterium]|nr:energy transducer TonB [Bradyrhizobiaceae bacterium]